MLYVLYSKPVITYADKRFEGWMITSEKENTLIKEI